MDQDVPYLASIKNLHRILEAIQRAAVPEAFNFDFLKDMGFASSNDRAVTKLLKYIGLLDASNRPQTAYREFMDSTKAKAVLASRIRSAYDDLFIADKNANSKPATALKGWFKTKTGVGEAVAEKMATTFRALAQYADFSRSQIEDAPRKEDATQPEVKTDIGSDGSHLTGRQKAFEGALGLVYRIEVHLPDTQNVDTYRAIFRAIREELGA
jgi:Family of unknown function (DUF5343)